MLQLRLTRIGSTYSVSGSGIDTTYTPTGGSAVSDGIGSLTVSSGVGAIPSIEATQKTAGAKHAIGSGVDVTNHSHKVMRYHNLLPQQVL